VPEKNPALGGDVCLRHLEGEEGKKIWEVKKKPKPDSGAEGREDTKTLLSEKELAGGERKGRGGREGPCYVGKVKIKIKAWPSEKNA